MAARAWIGTSFELKSICQTQGIDYAVYQMEKCPTTGKEHLQFFVYLSTRRRLKGVQQLIGDSKAHLEIARHIGKAIEYCQKEETRISPPGQFGTVPSGTTKRNVVEMSQTMSVKDILAQEPQLWRNIRTLQQVRSLHLRPRVCSPLALFLSGATGTGKTRIAKTISDYVGDVYWKGEGKWWDHYDQEPLVIWDEFRGCDPSDFLRLVNYAPYMVEFKGGSVHFNSAAIIFTSNLELNDCFKAVDDRTMQAINRRLIKLSI